MTVFVREKQTNKQMAKKKKKKNPDLQYILPPLQH